MSAAEFLEWHQYWELELEWSKRPPGTLQGGRAPGVVTPTHDRDAPERFIRASFN